MFLVDEKLLGFLQKIKDGRFFPKSLGLRVDVTVLPENHDDFVALKEFLFLARQISDELLELLAVGFGQDVGQGMFFGHVAQPLDFRMNRGSVCVAFKKRRSIVDPAEMCYKSAIQHASLSKRWICVECGREWRLLEPKDLRIHCKCIKPRPERVIDV